jgi:hypothetical protein
MEPIGNLILQPQSRKEVVLPFRRRLRISEQVSALMQAIIACFPHVDLSDSTWSEWLKIWIVLAEKYGFARLEKVVNRLKFKLDFFPKPAELQRELDAVIEEERNAAKAKRGNLRHVRSASVLVMFRVSIPRSTRMPESPGQAIANAGSNM